MSSSFIQVSGEEQITALKNACDSVLNQIEAWRTADWEREIKERTNPKVTPTKNAVSRWFFKTFIDEKPMTREQAEYYLKNNEIGFSSSYAWCWLIRYSSKEEIVCSILNSIEGNKSFSPMFIGIEQYNILVPHLAKAPVEPPNNTDG